MTSQANVSRASAPPFGSQPVLYLSMSSIGRKLVMAVTGGLLVLFLFAHVAGNLQIFEGQEKLNAYAQTLRDLGALLWVARIGLLGLFLTHVLLAFELRSINRHARSQRYEVETTVQASAASLYMLETGLVIFFFVIIHLLHYTFGMLQPQYYFLVDAKGRHDVYSMVIHGFQNPGYAATYIFAMVMLGVHLSHAIWSMLQTLGWYSSYSTPIARTLSRGVAFLLVAAYISIPVAVQLGILRLPGAM